MSKIGFRILLTISGLAAAVPAGADELVVAEFQADQEVLAGDTAGPLAAGDEFAAPRNLYAEEIGGRQKKSWSIGQYTFSGIMEWGQRANYLAGEHYSDEQYFSLGSSIQVGESSETRVFYGYGRDRPGAASDLYRGFGAAETTRTGLSQTLYFSDQQASVGVGYAWATGDHDQFYQGREGHELNLTGEMQVGWGFNAHLEAGYGLYSYNQFEGASNQNSARTNMRAGISRSFTSSLSWGLHYSYVDEEFERSDLSRSRETWGLNLEYQY